MIKNNIKFLVLTCEKYLKTRAESIKNSWGKDQNINFLSDKNGQNETVSFDNLSSSYCDMWQRYFEYIKKTEIFEDWIFFADDDTYVNIKNLEKLIRNLDPQETFYIGKELFLSENATDFEGRSTGFPLNTLFGEGAFLPLKYASGGAGFLLSKKSFFILQKYFLNCNYPARAYNTDVAFGIWMRNCKINIKNNDLFNCSNPKVMNHCKNEILKSISYHYVDEKMMLDIHSTINEKI